jgi:hypothetical protein
MATTTPNYGWPVPTSTDYVKDGATAIEALGDAIDATVFGLPTGAITLISATTFSGSTSYSVNDVFSATYDNYVIEVSNLVPASTGNVSLRLRVGGADNTSSNYLFGRMIIGAANAQAFATADSALGSSFVVVSAASTVDNNFATVKLFSPFTVKKTGYSTHGAGNSQEVGGGNMTVTTSYTGFTLFNAGGGNIAGNVRVYGLRNTV